LGLPIVQRIIEQHAGTIDVESAAHGTTFLLVLPAGERVAKSAEF
jgi:nitrogen-specific signal transduction histidine kinase